LATRVQQLERELQQRKKQWIPHGVNCNYEVDKQWETNGEWELICLNECKRGGMN
jgi:hypothetical protein